MQKNLFFVLMVGIMLFGSCRERFTHTSPSDYPIVPIAFTDIQLTDGFWLPRMLTNTDITIPIAFRQSEETGRIRNFEVAGGMAPGSFCSIYPFDDSDVFKIMEGAAYSLMVKPDPVLESYLDTLIHKISLAQEPDGYLYTNRTIMGDSAHEWAGTERWQHVNEHSHELYNVGHMYEAAVAHYQATGKKSFLSIALKNADLVYNDFGWGKVENYPGHQEIEIGLVKLYRVTGDRRYLELAKFFLDVRGPDGWAYNQAHERVVDQLEPVGHAVRALYMYSAMADVAALSGDRAYLDAITAIWEKVVTKKMYITGGVGQTGGNEGFGPDYELPNMSAYCETCASIANVFWNHRMFLLSGDARYLDVMERTMYNALLSGAGLSGDLFFYPNPLESDGQHQRKEWFGCACCPSNISRFLPSVPGYVYARKENDLYVNLYIAGHADIQAPSGALRLEMHTDYPWDGRILLRLNPEQEKDFKVHLRIPGWSRNEPVWGQLYRFKEALEEPPVIRINEEIVPFETINGFAVLERTWEKGDRIELVLPTPVRQVLAHDSVRADRGRFALQKGPLVYCLEGKDQDKPMVRHVVADMAQGFKPAGDTLFNGITSIELQATDVVANLDGSFSEAQEKRDLKAIPYAYWANRGPGQMLVWVPYDPAHATPEPAPTIANRSTKSSSGAKGGLKLLSDQYDPANSNDRSVGYIHWWPEKDTVEWIIYKFDKMETVNHVKVYWFDDGPDGGCRIPQSWTLLYRSGKGWKPVGNKTPYSVTKDAYDILEFEPVTTTALKLQVMLQEEHSGGVHEWAVGH
jgi:DUF1680 family protein